MTADEAQLYVADTVAMLAYLSGSSATRQLGQDGRAAFNAAEKGQTLIIVSVISLMEMYAVNRRKNFFDDVPHIHQRIKQRPFLRITPVDVNDALSVHRFDTLEMHDAIILGLTDRLSATLITSDAKLINAKVVPAVW
jgi:PIN domain nuclease of toxin-antitoxin system